MSRWKLTLGIAVFTAGLVAACTTSPTGRTQLKLVSDAEMAQMGATAFQQLKQKEPISKDGKSNSYVQCVANAIIREVGGTWEVQVFDSKEVNAFALPGGKIGVYTGLLKVAANQDQLAAVIGHEIAHVLAGHSAARVSNQMATQLGVALGSAATGVSPDMIGMGANLLLLMPYGRGDETEADVIGLELMAKAGFNPQQAPALWVNMGKASSGNAPPEFMSTHPSNESRIRDLTKHLPKAQPLYDQARAQGKTPRCS
jgi:predicted Zn-dependent protease